jgi:hypothetical protein
MLGRLVRTYGVRFVVTLILTVALLNLSAEPIQSQGPVELDIGHDVNIPWNITNVYPGSSGNATFNLLNTGDTDGFVYISIIDIVNTEGLNPESETGNTAEPGELMNFLRFNVISSEISTNVGLPATLHYFPHSVPEKHVMTIPLNANANTTLLWEWEFAEIGLSVNDAQGDSLSFSISFTLVDELYPEVTDEENEDSYLHYVIPPHYDPPDQSGPNKPVDDNEESNSEPDSTVSEPDMTPDEPDIIEILPSVDVTETKPDDSGQPITLTDTGSSGIVIWVILGLVFTLVLVTIILTFIRRRQRE